MGPYRGIGEVHALSDKGDYRCRGLQDINGFLLHDQPKP